MQYDILTYLYFVSVIIQAIFMHDPFSFMAMRSTTSVEDKSLTKSNLFGAVQMYGFVSTSSLPEPGCSGPVGSGPSRILLVFVAKEVPLILRTRPNPAFLYIVTKNTQSLIFIKCKKKIPKLIQLAATGLLYVCNLINHWLILRAQYIIILRQYSQSYTTRHYTLSSVTNLKDMSKYTTLSLS